jgi:hypothetical protein
LENEIISLHLRSFDTIQDLFTKFKPLLLQLKLCGIDKMDKEEKIILSIMSKVGTEYSVFVSTFCTTKYAFKATWKMPSLDNFVSSLTQEKYKHFQMDSLKTTKAHSLATNEGSKTMKQT